MASDKFVSRGGDKLQAALYKFQVDVKDKAVLDVGSSTGGFVDCLLQNGAKKIYSVDTAYGELAWKLRNDPRVVVLERTNILHFKALPEQVEGPSVNRMGRKVDLVTIDTGWTKLELVLPVIKNFLNDNGSVIALLKPNYEDPKKVKGGVVPEELVEGIVKEVRESINGLGFKIVSEMESPILGGKGNKEYLLLIQLN